MSDRPGAPTGPVVATEPAPNAHGDWPPPLATPSARPAAPTIGETDKGNGHQGNGHHDTDTDTRHAHPSPPPLPPPAAPGAAASSYTSIAPGGTPLVEAIRVSKWFGDVVAVSDVSFSVGPGVTALLGPNGAGKSTMMRILCGLAKPSQGDVRVLGRDPRRDLSVFAEIGIVPQQEGMFEHLTPMQFVMTAAKLAGVEHPFEAAGGALTEVAIAPKDTRLIGTLSKGTRQRVKIAAGIVHDPRVLVLDEPLTGLDPRQRLDVITLVKAWGEQPDRAVIVSSHVLDEVERFGSRILVIAQGRLAAEGNFRAIRDLMDDRPHRLRVMTDEPARLAAGLMEAGLVLGAHLTGERTIEVETNDVQRFRTSIATVARARRAQLIELTPLDDDLDSVFRYLVGR
ncbi:MAG: ABC transporter ATP-binding protein [Acidimicrobiia bacterium]